MDGTANKVDISEMTILRRRTQSHAITTTHQIFVTSIVWYIFPNATKRIKGYIQGYTVKLLVQKVGDQRESKRENEA